MLVEDDLLSCELTELLDGVDLVFHQAGQPCVRLSWADGFDTHVRLNVLATQRLLEAAKRPSLKRFVYTSSSSVYGAAELCLTDEGHVPTPMSPFGVAKLAAEHLCSLYHRNFGVPTVPLRYCTVYGPRQRPDITINRLSNPALTGSEFTMFGDGSQIRDFTYVDDVVATNLAATLTEGAAGDVINIGGGSAATMQEVVAAVAVASNSPRNMTYTDKVSGDVFRTGVDIPRAAEALGWEPKTGANPFSLTGLGYAA